MKRILAAALSLLFLAGCASDTSVDNGTDIEPIAHNIGADDGYVSLDEIPDQPVEQIITPDITPPQEMNDAYTGSDIGTTVNRSLSDEEKAAYYDFTLKLLQSCADPASEGNMMISPLSVMSALGMTANGAVGNTLSQIEDLMGMELSSLNSFIGAYSSSLPSDDNSKFTSADSIWYRTDDSLRVNEDFLAANQKYYAAEVRGEAFDEAACDAINDWVSEHTDGMIPNILDEIPADAVMYLINALAFDGKWETEYTENSVHEGVFTSLSGNEQTASMMQSEESVYLKDDNAEGFMKYYEGRNYAFAALLPDEGITPDEYISALTPDKLQSLLSTGASDSGVTAIMPKFEADYDIELSDVLCGMGLSDLFDSSACDLSGAAVSDIGNIYVSRVLHKTYISVDEVGTKAAAATAVETVAECAIIMPIVYLDRPFVYMIIDTVNRLPIFIGTVEALG